MINIVLFEPEIPQNTGNIARTCAVVGARLHIVGPIAFDISDKAAKRAGMDYWKEVEVIFYESIDAFYEKNKDIEAYYYTTKAHNTYCDVAYGEECYLIFGKESAGIPEEILVRHEEQCVRIPMKKDERSLNLSNCAAIAAYEVLRQGAFKGLEQAGTLHRLSWE